MTQLGIIGNIEKVAEEIHDLKMKSLEIITGTEKVAEEIRDYSRSQIELWQRIPLLALEADGRTGFNGKYSNAYYNGFWELNGSVRSVKEHYLVYVDLSNGELVDAHLASSAVYACDSYIPKKSVLKPARNKEVLQLAFNLDELDAQEIVTSLEKESKEAYPSYCDLTKHEEWRTKTRAELNLPEFYVRQR